MSPWCLVFREIGCFPPIVHTLDFGKFGAFRQWTAGGMSTSSWSAATPNTTASITEFSYKRISSLWVGIYALGPCSTTRSAGQSYRADSWWRASNGSSEARKHSNRIGRFLIWLGDKMATKIHSKILLEFFLNGCLGDRIFGTFFSILTSQVDLTPPWTCHRNNDATPEPKAVPPAKYVADCGWLGEVEWCGGFSFFESKTLLQIVGRFWRLETIQNGSKQRTKIHLEFIAWRQHGEFLWMLWMLGATPGPVPLSMISLVMCSWRVRGSSRWACVLGKFQEAPVPSYSKTVEVTQPARLEKTLMQLDMKITPFDTVDSWKKSQTTTVGMVLKPCK